MNDIKVINKKKKKVIEIKLQKIQSTNDREINCINQNQITGLLKPELEKGFAGNYITFDFMGLVPLCDFVKENTLSEKDFVKIIKKMMEIIKDAGKLHFSKNLFVFDVNYTMIFPDGLQVYFLYVPVQPYRSDVEFRDFLLDFLSRCKFEEKNTDHVKKCQEILKKGKEFSLFDLEHYINSLDKKEEIIVEEFVCPSCGYVMKKNEITCQMCGYKKETSVSKVSKFKFGRDAYLLSKDQYIKYEITRSPFVVGSAFDCTDCCLDADTISKRHAVIEYIDGDYFLSDLGSTNGTHINGKIVVRNLRTEIKSGDVIELADKEYLFFINEK